jgi:multiple sugar transport system ATP-binding protein
MATVTLDKVTKRYGDNEVVKAIDLEIPDQELVVLVGPSGCGKSTTLRMIAGLESISGGEICIDGRRVNEVAPKDRDIAMVFQSYALYPHMTVRENLEFGLKMRRASAKEIDERVTEAAQMLGLSDLLARRPKQLSGGQRQRVAMGRAIVRRPKVFLFDEPLSNLDAKLRAQMRVELARLHNRLKVTMVYVTHDQVEAMTLADRIVVMNQGHIQQVGAPLELYQRPANRFVAGFLRGSPGPPAAARPAARGGRTTRWWRRPSRGSAGSAPRPPAHPPDAG